MSVSGLGLVASDGLPVLGAAPGHLARCAQQLHAELWQQRVPHRLTSMQYGVLLVLGQQPGADQRTVAELMSLDKTTAAGVLRRLESRGFVVRERDAGDGRRMLARLTDEGTTALLGAAPAVLEVQDLLLKPLTFDEGEDLLRVLRAVAYQGVPPSVTAASPENAPVPGWPLRLPTLRLHTTPGHLVRRTQQLHTTLWAERVSAELTSVQYSALLVLHREAPLDQRSLGRHVSFDKSTGGDVTSRLESRRLITRARDMGDSRRNVLALTESGRELLWRHAPGVLDVQRELMRPLTDPDRALFLTLMQRLTSQTDTAEVGARVTV
ncbi:MarR family winged helix-turn-helix transcriptional regulator [Streptomyces sp. NPDC058464]|uniref:MarR family winged helix-turn-helix transcriptional regulator n=1 Tax=Streptomyces sp. NPDC058464 TaxID=3346511 RepID=UPI00364B3D76